MLQYKTRGMAKPQGKPRVYFCSHPADYTLFDEISDELLANQNCAVWYDDSPENRNGEDELLADLSQMQLFVIPITARFLIEPNRAYDTEFRYANEQHIPILPLMLEPGLDELFNNKCGDLHYIDRSRCNQVVKRYKEKLTHYLSSVLIEDKLAEKVRSAFSAYIFLSYRKKDRKYAQNLMHLIHKNEFCRDIAIWYDDFLNPGENFNNSIKDALIKSRLFTLVVTPNLVNEDNYVMQIEYPAARSLNKPILPVEAIPTDKTILADKYSGLPKTVNQNEELNQALLEHIRFIASSENDSSPEHIYLIGLAYFGGIDVEVDYKRAVTLITDAAEAGLSEAIEKLAVMYKNGEGVKRNYCIATKWQIKLVDILEDQLLQNKYVNLGLCARIMKADNDLSDLYIITNRLAEAEARLIANVNRADLLTKDSPAIKTTPVIIGLAAEAHNNLARYYIQHNKAQSAIKYLKQAINWHEKAPDSSEDYELAECHDHLAICYSKCNQTDAAISELKQAYSILSKLYDMDQKYLLSLAVHYQISGRIYSEFDCNKAKEMYRRALSILRSNSIHQSGLLDEQILQTSVNLAMLLPDDFEEAYTILISALDIGKHLVGTNPVHYLGYLPKILVNLGILLSDRDTDMADSYYSDALQVTQELASKQPLVYWDELTLCCYNYGVFRYQHSMDVKGLFNDACYYARQQLEAQGRETSELFALSLMMLGLTDKSGKAEAYLLKAMQEIEKLFYNAPEQYISKLNHIYRTTIDYYESNNNDSMAEALNKKLQGLICKV